MARGVPLSAAASRRRGWRGPGKVPLFRQGFGQAGPAGGSGARAHQRLPWGCKQDHVKVRACDFDAWQASFSRFHLTCIPSFVQAGYVIDAWQARWEGHPPAARPPRPRLMHSNLGAYLLQQLCPPRPFKPRRRAGQRRRLCCAAASRPDYCDCSRLLVRTPHSSLLGNWAGPGGRLCARAVPAPQSPLGARPSGCCLLRGACRTPNPCWQRASTRLLICGACPRAFDPPPLPLAPWPTGSWPLTPRQLAAAQAARVAAPPALQAAPLPTARPTSGGCPSSWPLW